MTAVPVPPRPAGADVWPVPHPERRLAAVARPDGTVVVVDAVCPHNGGPLDKGTVRDGRLVCPWHWYAFDLGDGRCATAREAPLAVFEPAEVDGVLWVDVPAKRRESFAQMLRRHAAGG